MEITSDIMDDEKVSLIYDEAENRLHAQMAVLDTLINQEK
jgi:ornithine carbamoyltransferase